MRLPSVELTQMVRGAQCGDARATDALLTALRPCLVAFFRRRVSASDEEDLAQLTLIRFVRALPRIDAGRADRYLVTIASNVARSHWRRRAPRESELVSIEQAEHVESVSVAPEARLEHAELAAAIDRAARTSLRTPLREIVLGLLRGLTPSEIATRSGINQVTIRTRLMRARELLRPRLQSYLAPC